MLTYEEPDLVTDAIGDVITQAGANDQGSAVTSA